MKKLFVAVCMLGTISAFAQANPNQVCHGKNRFNEMVQTELFIGSQANPSLVLFFSKILD